MERVKNAKGTEDANGRRHGSAFLDPEQAAEFLGGLNSRTVTRWARKGYLPAIPVGEGKRRLWRFREADLEQWMLARMTGPLIAPIPAAGLSD